jgi:hypothetical protein
MNINFPFFQSKDSITTYCGSIKFDSDNKVLYVYKGKNRTRSVKEGILYTSFSSIGSVSIDYLNQLVDQCNKHGEKENGMRFNAIIVEHHLLKPPIGASSTPTRTRIYIAFEKGEANEPYYFNHISVSPTKGNKEESEQFVIILSTRRYSQVNWVVLDKNKYEIKDYKSIDLNKVSTKPLVIKVLHSFSETPRPREEKFTVGNVNLLEALIGAHIFVQSGVGHRRYQFTEIIPTPQLSRYFNFVKNTS